MADSGNESELSEISLERFRVLEDYYEANYQESVEGPELEDELDDEGFSAAEMAAAFRESRQEQDRHGSCAAFAGPSGSAQLETSSDMGGQNDRKRRHSWAYGNSLTKKRRSLSEKLTIRDRQNAGPLGERLEFEVMGTLERRSTKPTGTAGLQSVAQASSKSDLTTAEPPEASPYSPHDIEQKAYFNHVDFISGSRVSCTKSTELPLHHTFDDPSQESGGLQISNNGAGITLKHITDSKETSLIQAVEGSTKADEGSNGIEQALKQTKSHSKHPPKRGTLKKPTSRKADRLWEVDTVVTDPNSPLVNVSLHVSRKLLTYIIYDADVSRTVLMKEEAWTSLSLKQQKKLISMLPNAAAIEIGEDKESLPNILKAVLQSSAAMKADVRLFQEDLSAGRLEPEWQLMARRAMRRRACGDFDEFESKQRAEIWGVAKGEAELDGQRPEDRIKREKRSKKR